MANQPTKYKKFVATAATATLVASAIVPVASAASFTDVSADSEYKVFIDKAVELKLFNDAEKFNPTQSVKRSQVVLVMGRLLEEAGFKADADYATNKAFSDVSSDELLKYGNIVKKAGVFTGYTDGTLKPNDNINRENMAAVFNRAAEAITGVSLVDAAAKIADKTVADLSTALTANQPAIQALRDLEISTAENFGPKGDVQRRHFAKFAVTAVEVIETLKVKEAAELSVKSVKTVDSETIEIELTDAIVAKSDLTKITASYFEKDAKTATPIEVTAELSKDGKVITLTTATAAATATEKAVLGFEGKVVTVKVPFEVLTTEKGEFIAPGNFTTEFASVTPKLVSIEGSLDAKGEATELTLEFDKKLASVEAIKIGSDVLTVKAIAGKKVTVTSAKALKAGNYDVTVVNAKDFAGNALATTVKTVTLAADETTPEVVSVTQVKDTENQVEIVLSEELATDLTATTVAATVGTFTKNAIASITKDAKDGKKYLVTLANDQLVNASSTTVKFTFAKEVLVDAVGNKNKEAVEKTVTLSLDKEIKAPTTAVKNNALTLTFAEEVTVAKTLADIEVVSAKGEILKGSDIFTAIEASKVEKEAGKVFTLTAKEGVTKGAYTVVLPEGFATDKAISANKVAKTTLTVTVGDVVADVKEETEFAVKSVVAVDNVITVDFGTKVVASALELSNYTVAGAALTDKTAKVEYAKVDGSVDQSKVVITLADQTIATSDDKAVVTIVAGVKAINEKTTKAFTGTVKLVENVSPEFKSVVATDVKELTFTFSEDMAIKGSIADEIKLFDKDGKAVAIASAKVVEGKVVVGLGEVLASTVTAYEIVDVEKADLTDVVGNEVKAFAKTNR